MINLHTASEKELQQVKGIGQARARRITQLRRETRLSPELLAHEFRNSGVEFWQQLANAGDVTFGDGGATTGPDCKGTYSHPSKPSTANTRTDPRKEPVTHSEAETKLKTIEDGRTSSEDAKTLAEAPRTEGEYTFYYNVNTPGDYELHKLDRYLFQLSEEMERISHTVQQVRDMEATEQTETLRYGLRAKHEELTNRLAFLMREYGTMRAYRARIASEPQTYPTIPEGREEFWSMYQPSESLQQTPETYIDAKLTQVAQNDLNQTREENKNRGNPQVEGDQPKVPQQYLQTVFTEDTPVASTPLVQRGNLSAPMSAEDIEAVVSTMPPNGVFQKVTGEGLGNVNTVSRSSEERAPINQRGGGSLPIPPQSERSFTGNLYQDQNSFQFAGSENDLADPVNRSYYNREHRMEAYSVPEQDSEVLPVRQRRFRRSSEIPRPSDPSQRAAPDEVHRAESGHRSEARVTERVGTNIPPPPRLPAQNTYNDGPLHTPWYRDREEPGNMRPLYPNDWHRTEYGTANTFPVGPRVRDSHVHFSFGEDYDHTDEGSSSRHVSGGPGRYSDYSNRHEQYRRSSVNPRNTNRQYDDRSFCRGTSRFNRTPFMPTPHSRSLRPDPVASQIDFSGLSLKKKKNRRHRSPSSSSSEDSDSSDSSTDSSSESSDESSDDEHSPRERSRVKRTGRRKKSPSAPQLQMFRGEVNEWENFFFYFSNTSKQYRWKKKMKLSRLKECLRGKAVEYVRTLPKSHTSKFRKLVKALQERFGSDDQPHILRKVLQDAKQETSESLDDFADRTQQLAQRAYKKTGKKVISCMGVDAFLKGIRDKNSVRQAAYRKPKTVREALQYVKEAAAIDNFLGKPPSSTRYVTFDEDIPVRQTCLSDMDHRPRVQQEPTGPNQRDFKRRPSPFSRQREGQQREERHRSPSVGQYSDSSLQRSSSPHYSDVRDDRCFRCNERGHFQRECPQRYPRTITPTPRRERQTERREFATSPARPSTSRSVSPGRGTQTEPTPYNKSVYQGSTLNTPGWTMTAVIYLNGQPIEAVIDTASQVTLIGQKVAERMQLIPEEGSSIRIHGIGDNMEMQAKIIRNVQLSVGQETFQWDLIVGPAREICILGIDFLNHVQAIINFQKPFIQVGNSLIPVQVRANIQPSETASAVSTIEGCEVRPFSGRIIQCRLSSIITDDFMIEASMPPHLNKHLTVPESLFSGGDVADIHIFNATGSAITVPSNTKIASAWAISEVMKVTEFPDAKLSKELSGSPPDLLCQGLPGDPPSVSFCDSGPEGSLSDSRPPGSEDVELLSEREDVTGSDSDPEGKFSASESTEGCSNVSQEDVPTHLKQLFEKSGPQFSSDEKKKLRELLIEFQDVFAKDDYDLGEFQEILHTIDTGDAAPVKCGLRRTPLGFQEKEEEHLRKMLDAGVIQPSVSEWAAAPVIVKKKCGSYRYCLDYRGLNGVTRKDNFPLPLIEECLDTLADNFYFSTLDMASGYWQLLIDPADRHKTAFLTKYGLFEHVRLAMGLCNSPATYQRAMTLVLKDLLWKDVLAYLDDLIILGKDFESHLLNLRNVFLRFRKYNLKFKPKKCVLFGTEVDFLGRRVSRDGVSIPESKIKTVVDWARPMKKTQLEAFLGFVNYHRDFIPHLAEEASVLYELVKKSNPEGPLDWADDHEAAFLRLKQAMVTAPILGYPRSDDTFILDTDASDHSIGAELSQVQEGKEVVIAYGSMSLNAQQKKYCTTRKELLALVTFLNHFRFYLLGRSFLVRTDHNSLTWLMRFRNVEGQLARWIEAVAQFNFKIVHRAGRFHGNADGLSRISSECDCLNAGKDVNSLPCGGCIHCVNKHQQWQRFEDHVDDVVPLAIRCATTVEEAPAEAAAGISFQTDVDWSEEQIRDPEIGILHRWLEEGEPTSEVLYLQSSTTKRLWTLRSLLELKDGILYYKWTNLVNQAPRQLIVVPFQLRRTILALAHDVKTAGHPGQLRTRLKILLHFFWPGITSDVRQFVESCKTCNTQKKGNRTRRAQMKLHHAGSPMERVHVDILGPFVESCQGNRYVLVMVDQFTKWIELAPLADQTAQIVAETLVHQFVCRLGCAQEIFTDQGRNFESALFKEICELLEMAKVRTTPYRPSSNGQVERMNREILFKIRAYLDHRQRDWDLHLPFIGMALRSTVNESTGLTPNMMMLGREIDLPIDLLAGKAPAESTEPTTVSEYTQQLTETLHDTHVFAREKLGASMHRRKKYYDLKQYKTSYEPGDLVYTLNGMTKKGQSRKLQSIYCGPYLVTHKISDILYQIQGRKERDRRVLHHDRLKICRDRDIPLWLQRKRASFLQNAPAEPETEAENDLHNLWQSENQDATEEHTPGPGDPDLLSDVLDDNFLNLGDVSSPPGDTSSPPEEPAYSPAPETEQGNNRLPGVRRRLRQDTGTRPMLRQSRPPAWLADYVI